MVSLSRKNKFWLCLVLCLTAALLLAGCGGSAEEETTETTVFVDLTPPQITGVRDYTVYVGDSVDFLEGIEVTDDADPCPKLKIDTNSVFFDYPGVYTADYVAWDESGNESYRYATVTVLEKPDAEKTP